jgi:type VI secretion system secreted protein VgrG
MGDSFSGSRGGATVSYSNHFTAIPQKVAFRPPRVTPKPTVQGPQTAIVVGKQGEDIWCDKYGRVKVQFHWDREGKRDENSSCWVRASQPWGGKGWGGMWIPRIGQEVIVEFLEGDPDRPIITGRVYNAEQMPPYDLPQHSTRSTMKSRSSKGGGTRNFNELRFEDKTGAEQVFLHGEKDFDFRAKHDSREWVGNDRSLVIKGSQKESVEGNKHAKVTGDQAEQIGGKMSLSVSGDCHQKIGSLYVVQSGQEIHLTSGAKVVIDAGAELTIKAAGGFIEIGPAGITIQGAMVNINSGGSAGGGSGCSPGSPAQPDVADDGTQGGKM